MPRRRAAPGIRHSPGRGAAGAALNKEGKSEHGSRLTRVQPATR
jgi:hypothetical protein